MVSGYIIRKIVVFIMALSKPFQLDEEKWFLRCFLTMYFYLSTLDLVYLPRFLEDSVAVEYIKGVRSSLSQYRLTIITHYWRLSEHLGPARYLLAKPAHDINLPSIMSYNRYWLKDDLTPLVITHMYLMYYNTSTIFLT